MNQKSDIKYVYLPHTADAKFIAYGRDIEEAFANSALAMSDIVTDHSRVAKKATKDIRCESEDEKSLLYDFLEQFIILLDSEGFLLAGIERLRISHNEKFRLTALASGDTDMSGYEINTAIKAVTYQEMDIIRARERVSIQVVIDI
ncbi:MAG TPA: archease [Candidatus Wallbacteria bacterium]|nr:archease [Candidatus Wallbacteria bacterium]